MLEKKLDYGKMLKISAKSTKLRRILLIDDVNLKEAFKKLIKTIKNKFWEKFVKIY